jgi:O-antigen ligase/Tfp pilus assembly protein PilF
VIANACNRSVEAGVIFLIVYTPIYYGSVTLGATTVLELTVLFMVLVWVIGMVVQGNLMFRRTPLDIPIILFCAYSVISTLLFSKYTYASYTGLSLVLCISALYFIVVNHIRSETQLMRLLVVILLVGFIHAFSHLVQNASGLFRASTGVMLNVGNHFAGYMVIIIPLAVAMSFVVKDIGKRVLLIFAGIVMAAAMAFSLIAGAMLVFPFSLVLVALLFAGSESTRKKALILGGIVLCLSLVIFWMGYTPVFRELLSVSSLKTGSAAGRLSLWKSSLAMFADNPIIGTGLGTFDYIYPKYRLPDMYGRAVYAHSDWLQLLTELGVIGFIIFLCGIVKIVGIAKTVKRLERFQRFRNGLIVGGLSSIGAGIAHALVEFNFHIPAIAVLFTIIVALTVSGCSEAYAGESSIQIHMPMFVRVSASICLVLVVGFSAVAILRPYLADTYYRSGTKLEENLMWDEAAAKYQSALSISHNNSHYFYALGNVYAKRANLTRGTGTQGKWTRLASDAYHQAIELCPTYGDYYLVLGNLHEVVRLHSANRFFFRGMGDFPHDAEAAYVKAISFDPNNAFYHRTYGAFCLKQGKIQKAIVEYKKALQVYPSDLYNILNECYVILDPGIEDPGSNVGHPASSIQHPVSSIQKIAQEIRPQDVRSYVTLARFCVSKEWYDAALSEYQRAIGLAPGRIDLWKQLCSLLIQQGELQKAANLWRQFLSSHSATRDPQNAQAHAQLALVYIKQDRLDDAIQQYLAAADLVLERSEGIEPDHQSG